MDDLDPIRDNVRELLDDFTGRVEDVESDLADFAFDYQSARIFVKVERAPAGFRVLHVFSVTDVGVPASLDLYRFIATESGRYVFGHLYCTDEEDGQVDVLLRHSLLTDLLDPEELRTIVAAVATTANQVDDQIAKLFGGRLFTAS